MNAATDYERVYRMAFASVYPHYVIKVEKKDRTKEELHAVIRWLTGYTEKGLQNVLDKKIDFETFFAKAPRMHPKVGMITGMICGYRIEEIEDPLMQKLRYMDQPAGRQAGPEEVNGYLCLEVGSGVA